MTKRETVALLAKKLDLKQELVARVYDAIFDNVKEELAAGNPVRIYGIGTFKVVVRKERKGNNPKAGLQVVIPERKAVAFKVAKELKGLVK